MKRGGTDDQKRRAADSAVEAVESGLTVGLGTGSTAGYAIDQLGVRIENGLDITGIPTSYQSRRRAREAGIPLVTLEESSPDLAIDGADQFAGLTLIKGGGAAHAREKIVDSAADRLLIVADPTKEADTLDHPVPIEILPDARPTVNARLEDLGGEPTLRAAERKDGPVVTDNGNLILDCEFGRIEDPAALAAQLSNIPGVVEHGLFVGLTDEIHVGTADEVYVRTE